jgi:RNA polymerase sigma-54 factor
MKVKDASKAFIDFVMHKTAFATDLQQRALLSLEMKWAFEILQMPTIELAEWLKIRIEENPLLEKIDEENSEEDLVFDHHERQNLIKKKDEYILSIDNIPQHNSLRDHLLQQAREQFAHDPELHLAERIIDSLDERGFLVGWQTVASETDPLLYSSVITRIQNFDPIGIAACSIKECLLIQLAAKGKRHSLAYTLIENHYDDLLHYRLLSLKKKLGRSIEEISLAIKQDISSLDIYPGYRFQKEAMPPLYPDIIIRKEGEKWEIDVRDDMLPSFKLSPIDDRLWQTCSKEEKIFLHNHLKKGKLLLRFVGHRQKTLKMLVQYLIHRQEGFLSGDLPKLEPMTMKESALALRLHPSTISRACDNKYVFCPHGLFSLKSFFTAPLETEKDEQISNQEAKHLLLQLIQKENKSKPFTDEDIALEMKKEGIICSRRTVSKYRQSLNILSSNKRRFALRNKPLSTKISAMNHLPS